MPGRLSRNIQDADFLDFVEINSSRDALPSLDTVEKRVSRTPPGFRFGDKARGIATGHRVQALATPVDFRTAKKIMTDLGRELAGRIGIVYHLKRPDRGSVALGRNLI